MRRGGGEGSERAAGRGGAEAQGLLAGWPRFAHMGGAAERPNAGPHAGEKIKIKVHRPSFSKEKTQNLGFRMFFPYLGATPNTRWK
jgi:hypothetical protein